MRPISGGLCSVCGERLASPYAFCDDGGNLRCGLCQRTRQPFVKAAAYGSYDGGLRELLHLLKYDQVRPAANVLGRMLAEVIVGFAASVSGPVVVIPVPLHQRKLRQRGFNQSELIARAALKLSNSAMALTLSPQLLERRRETVSQIGLTSHQRRENIRGAFAVAKPEEVANREILLVDDVLTTGTTASECARVLLRAGASKIWVATVARTLKSEVQAVRLETRAETEQGDGMAMAARA